VAVLLVVLVVPAAAMLAASMIQRGAPPPAAPTPTTGTAVAARPSPTSPEPTASLVLGPARLEPAIVFASDEDGDYDLYRMDPGGGEPEVILESFVDETWPSISPDGRTIAFARGTAGLRDLWLMDADGSNERRLTSGPSDDQQPRWSPNGNRLAFVREERDGNEDLYVLHRRGGVLDQDTALRLTAWGSSDEWPAWAPDGEQILMGSHYWGDHRDLALIDPDRPIDIGSVDRLTSNEGYEINGTWIGDTGRILFASGPDYPQTRLVTRQPSGAILPFHDGRGVEFLPDVSPDGRFVVFSANPGGYEKREASLYIVPMRGRRERRPIAPGMSDARQADWGVLLTRRPFAEEPDPSAPPSPSPS
jgi:Tol biopolymer transport system component